MIILKTRKVSASYTDPILELADSMAPKVATAFLNAVYAVQNQVDLKQLADSIDAEDYHQVLAIINFQDRFAAALAGVGIPANVLSVRDALREVYAAATGVASRELPAVIGTPLAFNLLNHESVSFLENYEFRLIREVSDQVRGAVQQTVLRAFNEGGHPLVQAREIKSYIGLTARQEASISSFRQSLETGVQSSLKDALSRSLRDGRYDRTLLRAMNSGQQLKQAQIDIMVDRYRQRWMKYRAETVARTESLRASHMGKRELWRQAIQQGLMSPFAKRRWFASGDEVTCEECQDLDGTEVGIDEEFAPGVMNPPDPHPRCRCGQSLVASTLKNTQAA